MGRKVNLVRDRDRQYIDNKLYNPKTRSVEQDKISQQDNPTVLIKEDIDMYRKRRVIRNSIHSSFRLTLRLRLFLLYSTNDLNQISNLYEDIIFGFNDMTKNRR